MNKQEAIDILAGLYRIPVENGADEFAQEINKAIDMAIEALQDDWTLVSEPPKENGAYIVSLEDSVNPYAMFHDGKWYYAAFDCILKVYGEHEVIAWRPKPEPYKGGDTE